MGKVAMITGMESLHELNNMDFHSPSSTQLGPCWVPNCQQQRTTLSPWCGTIPRVVTSHMVTGWLKWVASIMEGEMFYSYLNTHWLYINLPSLHTILPPKLPCIVTEYLIHQHSILHSYCFWSRNSLHSKWGNRPTLMEFTWSYHVSHHPEADGLTEWWNRFLKFQLKWQLSDENLKDWSKVLQNAIYEHPIYAAASLIPRIHRSRNQGVEMGVAPLTISVSDLLAKRLLPVPLTLCPAGLGLSSKGKNASTRKQTNEFTELGVKNAIRPLWTPHIYGQIYKEGSYCAGWSDWS